MFDKLFYLLNLVPLTLTFGKLPLVIALVIILILFMTTNKMHLKIKYESIILLYILPFLIIHYPLNDEVVYFDIGQGDSTLIRDKFNRHVVLIDTGGKLNFGQKVT